MKKIFSVLIIVCFWVANTSFTNKTNRNIPENTISEQSSLSALPQDNPHVYWFFLRIKIDTRSKSFIVIGTGSRIESGRLDEFKHELWWGATRGQIAVGPFLDEDEATNSRLMYRKSRNKVPEQSLLKTQDEMHWFLVTFSKRQRSQAFKLERMPARVATGGFSEFLDALYEGLTFTHLAVGPFWDYNQAEFAKYVYRENE